MTYSKPQESLALSMVIGYFIFANATFTAETTVINWGMKRTNTSLTMPIRVEV
jgi:hypothetical protein